MTVFSAMQNKPPAPNGFHRLHPLVEPGTDSRVFEGPGRTGTRPRAPGSEHHLIVVAVMRWFLKSDF